MEPFRQKRLFYGIVKHLYFLKWRKFKFILFVKHIYNSHSAEQSALQEREL